MLTITADKTRKGRHMEIGSNPHLSDACLHQARPAGVGLHLLGAELVARNLDAFTRTSPQSSMNGNSLKFQHSDKILGRRRSRHSPRCTPCR